MYSAVCAHARDTALSQPSLNVLQGGKYFTGHWFYSLWNTALVVSKDRGRIKEDPVQLSPKHLFRASAYDNSKYEEEEGAYGNTQSLQTVNK